MNIDTTKKALNINDVATALEACGDNEAVQIMSDGSVSTGTDGAGTWGPDAEESIAGTVRPNDIVNDDYGAIFDAIQWR